MKNLTRLLCLLLAGCVALLAGCGVKRMTIEDFRGQCLASASGECLPGDACDEYAEILREDYGNAPDCRQACEQVHLKYARQQPMGDCEPVFENAQSLCNQYCNQRYWK